MENEEKVSRAKTEWDNHASSLNWANENCLVCFRNEFDAGAVCDLTQ